MIILSYVHQDTATCRTYTIIWISLLDTKQNPEVLRICLPAVKDCLTCLRVTRQKMCSPYRSKHFSYLDLYTLAFLIILVVVNSFDEGVNHIMYNRNCVFL